MNQNPIQSDAQPRIQGEEFLRKMRAGDAGVWDAVMPMLRRIALAACRDLEIFDELKEDIVQDVAMRVFTKWQSYSGRSALSTWIYAIARNRCLDELRKRVVRGEHSNTQEPPGEEATPARPESAHDPKLEQMLCVQQVLAELDAQGPARKNSHRIIDVLLYWVEHSPSTEEFAHFLQITVQAAKQRKYEIRKRLQELCRHFCGNDDCSLQLTASRP